jgi:hypothetical protein
MSFMFKGPAALTAGSTVPAESINSALSVAGTDLTVADDLTVKDIIIANTGSLTVNGSTPITSIEGGGAVLVTKSYVDTAISNTHKVQVLTSVTGGAYLPVDLSTHHVYYFANSDYGVSLPYPVTLTCTVSTSPAPVNGHRVFIAWTKRGHGDQTKLKLDFGSQIVQGPSNAFRYILLSGLHSSVLLYYASTDVLSGSGPRWYPIEGNGITFTNS